MACLRVVVALAVVAGMAAIAIATEPVLLMDSKGNPVRWDDWLEVNGPAAVVVWSSWVPGGEAVKRQLPGILRDCERRRLSLIVIDVQEPIEAAIEALGQTVEWLHDRHGAILKQYRVIELPAMIVVARDGSLMARLAPTAEALAGWSGQPEEPVP
jgi:hypothetical protein